MTMGEQTLVPRVKLWTGANKEIHFTIPKKYLKQKGSEEHQFPIRSGRKTSVTLDSSFPKFNAPDLINPCTL